MRAPRRPVAVLLTLLGVFALAARPAGAEPVPGAASEAPPAREPATARVADEGPKGEAEPEGEARDDDPRAIAHWRPKLEPYGAWVDDPTYGLVWIPHRTVVGERFSPYVTSGHWALDAEERWVWVSDFPFGGVVFHYGRWVWTGRGWAWIAGYRYAPAWVVWRVPTGEYDYVGWAPAPPTFMWSAGVAVGFGYPPPYYWVFCPSAYVFAPRPYLYVVTQPLYVRTLARHTRYYTPARVRSRATSAPIVATAPTAAAARIPARAWPAARRITPATRVVDPDPSPKAVKAVRPLATASRPAAQPRDKPRVVERPTVVRAKPDAAVRMPEVAPARVATPPPRVYRPAHVQEPQRRKR